MARSMSSPMISMRTTILLLFVVLVLCVGSESNGVWAFGAGNIPSFAYLEGKAFRHGDIEDVLASLAKKAGGGLSFLGGGSKFGGLDIKRVYFGNWLRDYSQAVDIAGLKKLPLQTIINLCMALGFLAHGYATGEFEVTADRLAVYLPTEHIDNPKGYGEGEDARKYHPKLRGPVDPRELEIDQRTGMKNYIANEAGSWDTSKGLVRRTLEACIKMGRQAKATNRKEDEYEAYRLLGQAMHTLEDYPAHSNFCELTLVSMGHHQVFCHVGDAVKVKAPNGRMVTPIVTGTFGGSDFIHSLLGEATDHISEASVSDLTKEMDKARSISRGGPGGPGGARGFETSPVLRELLFNLPGAGGSDMARQMDGIEQMSRAAENGQGKRPEDMTPEELHAVLWQILTFRDNVMRAIETTIEKIPGLSSLVEKITNSISVFVFTTIEPFLKPVLQTASTTLSAQSAEVINTVDQFEVFNDPGASDPTHSFLSKDHFGLILNEPCGQLAQVIVRNTVQMVVKEWGGSGDPRGSIDEILQCLFHPDFHDRNSKIQREMMQSVNEWVNGLGSSQRDIISRLDRNSVRNHRATRVKDNQNPNVGGPGYNLGLQAQAGISNYVQGIPGVQQAQHFYGQAQNFIHTPPPGYGGRDGPPLLSPSGRPIETPSAPPPVNQSSYPGQFNGPPPSSPYAPPSGPPPGPSSYLGQSSYPGQSSFTSGPPGFPTAQTGGPPGAKNEDSDSDGSSSSRDGRYGSETREQRKARRKTQKAERRARRHERHQHHHGGGPGGGMFAPPSGPPPSFPGGPGGGYPPPGSYNSPPPGFPQGPPGGYGFPGSPPPGAPYGGPPSQFPGGPGYSNYGSPPPPPPNNNGYPGQGYRGW